MPRGAVVAELASTVASDRAEVWSAFAVSVLSVASTVHVTSAWGAISGAVSDGLPEARCIQVCRKKAADSNVRSLAVESDDAAVFEPFPEVTFADFGTQRFCTSCSVIALRTSDGLHENFSGCILRPFSALRLQQNPSAVSAVLITIET